jgi:hypothetical protein
MNRTPDDAARLLALLVAICGPGINDYRPRIEALVATINANAKLKATVRSSGTADCRCLMCLAEGDNSPHRRRQAGHEAEVRSLVERAQS